MIYVRFSPGISIERRREEADAMGKALSQRAPAGHGRRWSSRTSGMPQNARSAPRQPERRAEHGLPPHRVLRPGGAQAVAGEIAAKCARDPHARLPGRRDAPVPGRARRERLRERLHGADRRRGARREPRRARGAVEGDRRGRAHRPRHPRRADVAPDRLPGDPRRHRSREGRVRRRRRRSDAARDDARGHARQHQHARRRGSTSTTGSRTTSSRSTTAPTSTDTQQLGSAAGARRAARGSRCCSAPTRTFTARSAPSPSSATTSSARRTSSCRPKGATSGARQRISRRRSDERPAHARTSSATFVRSDRADADDVLGARPRARAGGDGRLHDHGVAVQVAAAAVRHALHHPGVARGDRPGAHGRGAGLLDHRRSWGS